MNPNSMLLDFSRFCRHDPLKLIIRVRQAIHIASTTGARIVCLCLLRTLTCKVSNLITFVTERLSSWCRNPWVWCPFLDLSCLSRPCHHTCWFGTSSLSQNDLSSSTHDRQHPSRTHSDPSAMGLTTSFLPWLLIVVQLSSRCTYRTIGSSKASVRAKRDLADGEARLSS